VQGPEEASRLRDLQRYRFAAAGAAVVLVAVLAAQAIRPGDAPSPTGSFPATSGGPSSQQPPTTRPTEHWQPLLLAPYSSLADLTADRSNASGVAATTTFTLRSHSGTPAVDLARGLVASPTVKFRVTPGATADVANLMAASALESGAHYRFRLTGVDGALIGSWSFRVAGPLQVAGLLPNDRTTGVPTSTGIEVTFDQDGVTGFAEHFSIKPAVTGRFEQHDRTWVFVPTTPLAPGTLYTYSVHAGLAQTGSNETLERTVTASFETAASDVTQPRMSFDRALFDVRTGTRPLLGLWIAAPDGDPTVRSLPIRVYRFATIAAAATAAGKLATNDDWLLSTDAGLVDTAGLTRVGSFTAPLSDPADNSYVLHVPAVLAPGWYLLVAPRAGRDAQAVLQVTNLATYAASSLTTTIVWVNDLQLGTPAGDAAVAVSGGPTLGRTGADGILRATTPAVLKSQLDGYQQVKAHALTIQASGGRAAIALLGVTSSGHYPHNDLYEWTEPDPWWSVFALDRQTYRATDTIHVYGFVRSMADRSVPGSVKLVLGPTDGTWHSIVTRTVSQTARGTFVADIPIHGLPLAYYELRLYADGQLVGSQWLSVEVIRKPAFSIALTTDHHAYLVGQAVHVSATVTFFDGTTTPGLDLSVGAWNPEHTGVDGPASGTTDAAGRVSTTITATASATDPWTYLALGAIPTHPEEGAIQGETDVSVLPSKIWLTGTTTIRDGRLRLSGTVSTIDFAALDRQLDLQPWFDNVPGPGAVGKAVSIRVIHLVPVRHLLRTEYDYLEKRAVPVYEYDTREQTIGTYKVQSGSGGRFSLSVAVPNDHDSYRAVIQARDADGRLSQLTAEAWADSLFGRPGDLQVGGPDLATVGQTVTLSVRRADGKVPAGTFLYLVARGGIRDAVVSDAPTLTRTFTDADLPGFTVRAIRLSATGLDVSGDHTVTVDPSSRRLTVTLTPDQKRYTPGDSVSIRIRTTDSGGRPTAADVVVRAVDQKLFSIGAAMDPDTLFELMAFGGPGFLQSFASAFAPSILSQGGDGGRGGGGRGDLRDTATFQLAKTDTKGVGTVTFRLPDDLTSWHVSATAFSGSLEAGDGSAVLPVGLPIFTEATLAPDYLVGESPILRLRAYGEGLQPGDPVLFTVSAATLGLATTTVRGVAFQAIRVPLPALPAGDHRVEISVVRIGDPGLRDDLVRMVHVIPNRLTQLRATYQDLTGVLDPAPGVGLTTYLVTDAGRGALIPVLQTLAAGGGGRFDRLAAADAARSILPDAFQVPLDELEATGFDAARYQSSDGIAIVPYASQDLSLGALAAFTVRDKLDVNVLRYTFSQQFVLAKDPETDPANRPSREELIVAAAGRAALGDEVLSDLQSLAATAPPLNLREQLWLALGFLASGDENAARQIERTVLASTGKQLGPWVRLDDGTPSEADGLMLVLAAGLGDSVATRISRYLSDRPSPNRLFALEQLAYVRAMLDRLPRAAASFAWTADGQRHVETLEPGGSWAVELTPDQQRAFHLERLDGALSLTTTAVIAASSADLPSHPSLSIARTVSPASAAGEDQIVHVTIQVTFRQPESGSYTVTDLVPSGLAPIAQTADWVASDSEPRGLWPYEASGQRVSWSIDPNHNQPLVYAARVVSPGTYTWEPAVVQYDPDPTIGAATDTTTYMIR
jgi:hypothetical protein